MLRFAVIAVTLAGLTGCCCVRDARGPSSDCEVHRTPMKTEVIRDWGGCVLPTPPYAEARQKLFPHAYPDQLPSPWPWKRERIYVCPDCVRAQEEWEKHNPRANKPATGGARLALHLASAQHRLGVPQPERYMVSIDPTL